MAPYSDAELARIFSSRQEGNQEGSSSLLSLPPAGMTMRELEALVVSVTIDREKMKHSSSLGESKFVIPENKVGMTLPEDADFMEKLRPKFDLEAFLEEYKDPSKVKSSFGGSVRDKEAGMSLNGSKSFKESEEGIPPRREYSSPEDALKGLLSPIRMIELCAVKLALDSAEWKRRGVSKSEFVKEEAVKFLKDTFGSSGKDKFSSVYKGAENAFFCHLYEDELKAIEGKDEVVAVKLVDELTFLRLSGLSSKYTMTKKDGFGEPVKVTVFDL